MEKHMINISLIIAIVLSTVIIASCTGQINCANNEKIVSQCDYIISSETSSLSCIIPAVNCTLDNDAENGSLDCDNGKQIKFKRSVIDPIFDEKTEKTEKTEETEELNQFFSAFPIYKRGENNCSILSQWGFGCQYTVKCNIFGICKTSQQNCAEKIEEFQEEFQEAFQEAFNF